MFCLVFLFLSFAFQNMKADFEVVPLTSCPNSCSGSGKCLKFTDSAPFCACADGFSGEICELQPGLCFVLTLNFQCSGKSPISLYLLWIVIGCWFIFACTLYTDRLCGHSRLLTWLLRRVCLLFRLPIPCSASPLPRSRLRSCLYTREFKLLS